MNQPIILIDNFDSFTRNLITYLNPIAHRFQIFRNDALSLEELTSLNPAAVIISPGPGRPCESGVTPEITKWAFSTKRPLLGVCLGHQAIGEYFGGSLKPAQKILHGHSSKVTHDGLGVFGGLPSPFTVGRYHSLVLDRQSLSDDLIVTAESDDGDVMGIRHRDLPIEGVQFHPESVLTPQGKELLANFTHTHKLQS